jgi:hypothetical protein
MLDITSDEGIQPGQNMESDWSLLLILKEHLVCVLVKAHINVEAYCDSGLTCVLNRWEVRFGVLKGFSELFSPLQLLGRSATPYTHLNTQTTAPSRVTNQSHTAPVLSVYSQLHVSAVVASHLEAFYKHSYRKNCGYFPFRFTNTL